MSGVVVGLGGALLLSAVLWDAFETIILPRRITRRFRLARFFYRVTWGPWRAAAPLLGPRRREAFLAVCGTTFFTLGLGDVVPRTTLAKLLTVIESGTGFSFLAIVIGYLPVTYQAFSRREGPISLLDARAGSPPPAGALLWRYRSDPSGERLGELLREWERWAADVLESHLSYPPLAYFRSQHSNQSWLAALTTILDASALVIVGREGWCVKQGELTFAMARHAMVDLAQVFNTPPQAPSAQRLTPDQFERLRARLAGGGLQLRGGSDLFARLGELRSMYEPLAAALADRFAVALPPWVLETERPDNWQTSPWDRPRTSAFVKAHGDEAHF